MGQYWILVNLDKHQMRNMPGGGFKLGEGFWGCSYRSSFIASLIRNRLPDDYLGIDEFKKDLSKNNRLFRDQSKQSNLSKLPIELHCNIINCLDFHPLLSLSLACRYFFILCQDYMIALFNDSFKGMQWAGDRIIMPGDYLRKVPLEMLPADVDPEDWECSESGDFNDDQGGCEDSKKIYKYPLYTFALEDFDNYGDVVADLSIRPESPYAMFRYLSEIKSLPEEFSEIASKWCTMDYSTSENDSFNHLRAGDAVLRNLTTHEYVTNSGISHPVGGCQGAWNSGPVGFVEVLKCMICFSDSGSISMALDGEQDLHRGPWAGHRFDIVTVEEFEAEMDGNGWKDVTLEIRNKVKRVWDSNKSYNEDDLGPYPLKPEKKMADTVVQST